MTTPPGQYTYSCLSACPSVSYLVTQLSVSVYCSLFSVLKLSGVLCCAVLSSLDTIMPGHRSRHGRPYSSRTLGGEGPPASNVDASHPPPTSDQFLQWILVQWILVAIREQLDALANPSGVVSLPPGSHPGQPQSQVQPLPAISSAVTTPNQRGFLWLLSVWFVWDLLFCT